MHPRASPTVLCPCREQDTQPASSQGPGHFPYADLCYLNLVAAAADRRWAWWGRAIFHVDDVDALYRQALAHGLVPDFAPEDAPWGERYFHIIDPDGHELSFAKPII